MTFIKPIFISLTFISLVGCVGGSLKPDVTKRGEARTACPFTLGTIVSVQNTVIEGNVEAAQTTGAALGGYIGNRATKNGNDVEQVLGTVAGVAVGNVIGDQFSGVLARPGYNLFVELKNGEGISVVQEVSNHNFKVGDEVLVSGNVQTNRYYNQNRSCTLRVLPKE